MITDIANNNLESAQGWFLAENWGAIYIKVTTLKTLKFGWIAQRFALSTKKKNCWEPEKLIWLTSATLIK